jgi:hypothetical protein
LTLKENSSDKQNKMYGGYGWQTRPVSNVVELPLAPVRRRHSEWSCHGCMNMNWHSFGVFLSLLAAATLSLGIADVVVTYQNYMINKGCNTMSTATYCDPNNLVFTWVGVGIWASVPVFIFGIMAIRRGSKPLTKSSWFELFAFLCGFIFTPAMVVISAIEVYRGANVYYWTYTSPLTSDDLVKAIIPIVIAALGFIEHIMTAIAAWNICCCHGGPEPMYGSQVAYGVAPVPAVTTYDRPVYGMAPRTQITTSTQPMSFYNTRPAQTTYNYFSSMGNPTAYRSAVPNSAYNFFRG